MVRTRCREKPACLWLKFAVDGRRVQQHGDHSPNFTVWEAVFAYQACLFVLEGKKHSRCSSDFWPHFLTAVCVLFILD
jgi:hypothetical protein